MSITTNYKFKNAAAATVDIGTIFCDLTNDQTIAGVKTFSTTPIVATMATTDNSTSAASTAFVKAQGYAVTSSIPSLTGYSTTTAMNTAIAAAIPDTSTFATKTYVDTAIANILNGTSSHTICKIGVWQLYDIGAGTYFATKNTTNNKGTKITSDGGWYMTQNL